MEDVGKIVESLSLIERRVLPALSMDFKELDEISGETLRDYTATLRAIKFLHNKNLVESKVKQEKLVVPGVLGLHYLKNQLPERILLNKLSEMREIPVGDISKECGLNENEAKAALGALKKKLMVEVREGKVVLTATPEEVSKKMLEEHFLEKLPLAYDEMEPEDKLAFQSLKSRKDIVRTEVQKKIFVKLTRLGKRVSSENLDEDLLEKLTPKILKNNSWKGKRFRRYDIVSFVPKIFGGKRHFVNQAKNYGKKIWLEMGFKEMEGDFVESSFWTFDALFTAQDHPVRELHDTFYLKGLKAKLPEKGLVDSVRKAHEGGLVGSKGWNYKWSEEQARRVVLRTHTTALSSRTLVKIAKNKEFPAKYFAIGKAFRNETVDWSHGFEFNQSEGIVVDENANFRQLLGYLKEFARKMGFKKVKFMPSYFPYTEPSVEGMVWNETKKQWVEVFAAGIFRPEVTAPLLGKPIPVLAWGPGFDRMIMEFFKIDDLRKMYKNDINFLRNIRFWRM